MCGRFTAKMTWEEIVRLYRITRDQPPRNVQPRYNICPTDPVDVVLLANGKRTLVPMRWGINTVTAALKERPSLFMISEATGSGASSVVKAPTPKIKANEL
jgi:putative SOS response-associated peptidase YedK